MKNKTNNTYYKITDSGRKRFRTWLIRKDLTMSEFAGLCGCSVAYISMVINCKKHVTKKTRELFHKGGYDLL